MVEGVIVEMIDTGSSVWVNCKKERDSCGVFLERTPASLCITVGDSLRWTPDAAFWTGRMRVFVDVRLELLGVSGEKRPRISSRALMPA